MAKRKRSQISGNHNSNTSTTAPRKQAKTSSSTLSPPTTLPFDPQDRILLIGEGDLSFSRSLVEHHGCTDVTATVFDTKEQLLEKYSPQAAENVEYLEDAGQTVRYGTDARNLHLNKALTRVRGFDRVVFNFPHVGGKTKDVNRQVRLNQDLLVRFFSLATKPLYTASRNNQPQPSAPPTSSSKSILSRAHGTVLVTLFDGEPYTLWNIRDLARHVGLELQRSFAFDAALYPGYRHARTLGNIDGAWRGEERAARTFVFRLGMGVGGAGPGDGNGSHAGKGGGKKRRDEDDEDE